VGDVDGGDDWPDQARAVPEGEVDQGDCAGPEGVNIASRSGVMIARRLTPETASSVS
jgi:hypothetical protein